MFSWQFSGLWRDSDFRKLWTGQTISLFGSTVTREALPLTALLLLGATPLQMGLLAAIGSAPALVVGLFAGVWVDRLPRRPTMIVADVARAVLLLSLPLAALLGRLRIEHLFVVAPLVGVLTVFFDVAYQSFVPTLVRRDHVLEANAKLGLSGSLAEVTAPGIAGVLVQVVTAPLTLLIDAGTFLISALLLAALRVEEVAVSSPTERPSVGNEVSEGLRFVMKSPILRALAARALTDGFFGGFFAALYGLYCLRDLGMTPALLGIAIATGGLGSLFGALLADRLVQGSGVGTVVVGALGAGALNGLLIPLAGGPLVVAAGMIVVSQFLGDATRSIVEITLLSIRQSVTPDALLGRVNGSMYLVDAGVVPLGALVGGLLAEAVGARGALAVAVLGGGLGTLWIAFSPVRSLRTLPLLGAPSAG